MDLSDGKETDINSGKFGWRKGNKRKIQNNNQLLSCFCCLLSKCSSKSTGCQSTYLDQHSAEAEAGALLLSGPLG